MKPRVLIVEDESIVAMDLEATLERLGYAVAGLVARGDDAVLRAQRQDSELVLMDIGLGAGQDGIRAAEEIRRTADVPVVFVTANADEATLQRAQQSEPFGYVLKPFQERELRTTIEMALHQHRLERELRASRRWFETTLRSIGDAVIATDGKGIVKLINPVAEALTGWSQAEAVGRSLGEVFRIVDQASRTPVSDPVAKVMASGQVVTLQNHTILIGRDGQEVQIDDAAAPITDDQGTITGTVLTFRDVTARYAAEEARRAAESRYRVLFEAVGEAIVIIDEASTILAANSSAERTFGYAPSELVGQSAFVLMSDSWRKKHLWFLAHYKESPLPTRFQVDRELVGKRKDGSTFALELSISEMWVGGQRQFAGIARDISAKKALEAQLILSQKMEGIGRLAGGVAHDFNNLLTAIISYGTLLHDELPQPSEQRDDVQQILAAADRAATLTRQLLAFARRQVMEPRVIDLRELLTDLEPLLRRSLREDIQYLPLLPDELACVRIDPGQLERVLLNLVINAKDALPNGGTLRLNLAEVDLKSAGTTEHPQVPAGRWVMLRVQDDGVGMSPEVRSQVFEPFFSTKAGGGTGLGLATSYGIVAQAGGHLIVDSELGRGTSFMIYLPAVEGPADAAAPRPVTQVPKAPRRILVCEDNAIVRVATLRGLKAHGYETLEAPTGAEALVILGRQPVDLLLTDVVMPEMSGPELATAARAAHPNLPVLFMSGYTESAVLPAQTSARDLAFIAKPFTPSALVAKIEEIFGG
ncbi:MAG: response regulator [Deltaproteobacteria bacterium]|nr:response regulator [Deltaproteobacteria bacterium]